jgi:hypothetical protein
MKMAYTKTINCELHIYLLKEVKIHYLLLYSLGMSIKIFDVTYVAICRFVTKI